jgi:uncharacterized protein (TIGR03435 family)
MNPWVERLGWTLLHFLWEGALIAAVYAIGRGALKTRTPNARYLLACGALAAMVAAPIVTVSLTTGGVRSVQHDTPLAGNAISMPGVVAGPAFPVLRLSPDGKDTNALSWVVLLWLAGASVFSVRLIAGWWMTLRVRSCRVRDASAEWRETFTRIGSSVGVLRPVRLLVSAVVQVPTVVGWLRPVVLMPVGALTGLPPQHVEALLAHELAHIRRQDYLVNILQSIAEALLFYHPAVWWVSGHVRAERESCCDDIAAAASGDVFTYASALAELESLRPDRLDVAMAANGGLLGDRIARLLGQERAQTRPGPGVIVSAVLLVFTACAVFGQTDARAKFEVASIKRDAGQNRNSGLDGFTHGRMTAENTPLRFLVMVAYQPLEDFQIVGGPAWLDTDGYNVTAKAEGDASADQMRPMLQTLLEDRFQLKLHRETRELPVYTLAVAKNGLKLSEPGEGSCFAFTPGMRPVLAEPGKPVLFPCGIVSFTLSPAGIRMKGGATSIKRLTDVLSRMLHRTIIDNTGFKGTFDVDLEFNRDESLAGIPGPGTPGGFPSPTPASDSGGPSIFSALQERMGLRLESTKGPVEVLVIDHVERPTEN